MKTSAITALCLTLILAGQAMAQGTSVTTVSNDTETKKFSAEWRMSMKGQSQEDEQTQAKYVDLRLELKSKYVLTNSLYIDFQPAMRVVSGQSQTIDGADSMKNAILLNQAGLMYKPASFFQLAAGALDQRYNHTSLLIDSIAFPSARMQSLFRVGSMVSGIVVESAIPTSTSLSTNTQEKEPTPSLNSASVRMNYIPSKNGYWKNKVGYFAYSNLPSAVAQQSMLLGNEVNTISDAHYEFVNKYAGVEAGSEISVPVGTLMDLVLEAEYVKNTQAKDDVNTAYSVKGGTKFHVSSALDFNIMAKYFSVAPEAAVAYFNARGYETNRIGYEVGGYLSFLKQGFDLGASYKESEVMFTNTVQSREKFIMIKLETFYANI